MKGLQHDLSFCTDDEIKTYLKRLKEKDCFYTKGFKDHIEFEVFKRGLK